MWAAEPGAYRHVNTEAEEAASDEGRERIGVGQGVEHRSSLARAYAANIRFPHRRNGDRKSLDLPLTEPPISAGISA